MALAAYAMYLSHAAHSTHCTKFQACTSKHRCRHDCCRHVPMIYCPMYNLSQDMPTSNLISQQILARVQLKQTGFSVHCGCLIVASTDLVAAYRTSSAMSSAVSGSIPAYTASALALSPLNRTMLNSVCTAPGLIAVTRICNRSVMVSVAVPPCAPGGTVSQQTLLLRIQACIPARPRRRESDMQKAVDWMHCRA